MSKGSFSGWEIEFIRKLFFHEMVISNFESMDLMELLTCNPEMNEVEEFSKWIEDEDQNLKEDLLKWLEDRGFGVEEYNQLYISTKKEKE